MSFSLFELNEFIRQVLALNLPDAVWVRAELAQVKEAKGHFFIELVQKAETSDAIIAQGQAALWNKELKALRRKMGSQLDVLLQEGVELLFKARVEFHERFGLKLVIEDIDPAYTLGKLEMKRRETIRQLQQAGLLEKNKALRLPPVIQRIAVLTSEQAAGYQDFAKQLAGNSYGYSFQTQIFPIAVQGNLVEPEMLSQLAALAWQSERFDAAVVIRGGGARLNLAAFDSFGLCKAAANLPLPIITGIGHDADETVLDLVAYAVLKTPTAVADFIIYHNLQFEAGVENLASSVQNSARKKLQDGGLQIQHLRQLIDFQTKSLLSRQEMMLDYVEKEIPGALKSIFAKENLQLATLEKTCRLLSPETALRRGFSITTKNGKVILDAAEVQPGDEVETRLNAGIFKSIVQNSDEAK